MMAAPLATPLESFVPSSWLPDIVQYRERLYKAVWGSNRRRFPAKIAAGFWWKPATRQIGVVGRVGGSKKEQRTADTERLLARFSGLLNHLVTTEPSDGRVDRNTLGLVLSERLNCKEYGAALRRYLAGKERPRAKIAWALGESLHDVRGGVTWAGGLMMLFAAGRLREFVGVILCYLFTPSGPANGDSVRAIRDVVQCVDDLMIKTDVDFDPAFVGRHLEIGKSAAIARALKRKYKGDEFKDYRDVVTGLWKCRESAKVRWSRAECIREDLQDAFERWSEDEEGSIDSEFLPILLVAKSTDAEYFDREHEVFKMINRCFDDFLGAEKVKPRQP
jgi:hypothetical protein